MNNDQIIINPTGDTCTILHGEAIVYSYQGESHLVLSTDSLIRFIEKRGNKEKTVIWYQENQVQVVLDDSIKDRKKDYAKYIFPKSLDFMDWSNILNRPLSQKDFIQFLKNRPIGEVENIENLVANIQKLKIATEIVGEYGNEGNDVTFIYKAKDKTEGKAKLPTVIVANLEIINESGNIIPMDFELKINTPKSENEKPSFEITCEKYSRYTLDATKKEINKIKEKLDGYLIFSGKTEER